MENKSLSMKDYIELLQYIEENHSFVMGKGKRIKYITTTLDTRINRIFSIEFQIFGSSMPIRFHIADTPKGKTFKQLIYEWLEEG